MRLVELACLCWEIKSNADAYLMKTHTVVKMYKDNKNDK